MALGSQQEGYSSLESSSEAGIASLIIPSVSLWDYMFHAPTTLGSGVRGPGPPEAHVFQGTEWFIWNKTTSAI